VASGSGKEGQAGRETAARQQQVLPADRAQEGRSLMRVKSNQNLSFLQRFLVQRGKSDSERCAKGGESKILDMLPNQLIYGVFPSSQINDG